MIDMAERAGRYESTLPVISDPPPEVLQFD